MSPIARFPSLCGLLVALVLLPTAAPLFAQEYKIKSLVIEHPFARATPPAAVVAGAYLKVKNNGKESDRLVGASSPVAKETEVHEMHLEGGVMRMRAVSGIDIKPGATIALQPGGYHVMLKGLTRPLVEGDKFPLTLSFEKAGPVEVVVKVEAMGTAGPTH